MDVLTRWVEAWDLAESWLERADGFAAAVSAWPVGAHLAHLARTNELIVGAIRKTEGGEGAGERPARIWAVVRRSGQIPRGVGQAPEPTRPPEAVDAAVLRREWERSRGVIQGLEPLAEALTTWTGRVAHPYFGPLGAVDWLHFGVIHTHHHLAIIAEIAAA